MTVTVWLRPIESHWTPVGTEARQGVWAENLTVTNDRRGPLSAAFDLRRDPAGIWPDLAAYTPVEVEVNGIVVFGGRLKETPGRDAEHALSVQCEGLQASLDDDMYERLYVHTDLSLWKDARSVPTANLAAYTTKWTVETAGAIVIRSTGAVAFARGGVTLDLGPSTQARRVVIEWEKSASWAGTASCYLNTDNAPLGGAGTGGTISTLSDTSVAGTYAQTLTACRYLTIFCDADTAQADTAFFRVKAVRVFGQAAYENLNESALKASTVITDALTFTPLLHPDRGRITASSFNIPSLAPGEPKTPREIVDTVNAYHDWTFQIDAAGRPIFAPRSTAPTVKIGSWSSAEVEDASSNSGEDIYTDVIVTAQTPAGDPLRVRRTNAATSARLGFTRTKQLAVASPLPADAIAAAQIADVWLAAHTATPFKGTVKLTGTTAVQDITTGAPVAPEQLLLLTDQLLHFDDRVDPDTGALGRDGRITQVTYTPATGEATIAIDNTRGDLDALLARLAVTTSQ